MDQHIASLARTCLELGNISTFYDEKMPKNFVIPSLYFPSPETSPSGSALGSYSTKYSIYAKVFAKTKLEAVTIADIIVQGIMRKKCRLPIYNEDGTDSGKIFKMEPPDARGIDEGVAQITLTYRIIRAFVETKYPSVQSVEINKNYD